MTSSLDPIDHRDVVIGDEDVDDGILRGDRNDLIDISTRQLLLKAAIRPVRLGISAPPIRGRVHHLIFIQQAVSRSCRFGKLNEAEL
jgi:hypothetical protein